MREKQIQPKVLNKYIEFLHVVRTTQFDKISLKGLVSINSINKSVIKAMKELKIIEWVNDSNWWWSSDDDFKSNALEVLNYCLELNKKQIVTPITGLDDELKGYIREIRDHLISNSQNKQSALESIKTPMLSKALNQSEPKTLFSQTESNEAKKFELLKAVASGCYADTNLIDAPKANDFIIMATEDLFNKFFKLK